MRYGEADRILHLYTPERGRISAIAKGVRKREVALRRAAGAVLPPRPRAARGPLDLMTVTASRRSRPRAAARARRGARRAPRARATRSAGCSTTGDPHPGVYHLLANELALLDADPDARDARQRARLPAEAAARGGLRAAAVGVRDLRRGRAPRRLLRRGGRRGLPACEAGSFPLGAGRARFLVEALGAPARRDARRRPPRRWRRPTGRSARRSSTTRTCGCGRADRANGARCTECAIRARRGRAGAVDNGGREPRPRRRPSLRGDALRVRRGGGGAVAARHALLPGRPRAARGGLRAAHAVPARPRPDRALQGVPPAEAQDAGLRRAGGRPLPHAAHPHARGDAGSRAPSRARCGSTRTWPRRSGSGTTSATRRSGTSARTCSTAACASASGAASATTSTRCGWSSVLERRCNLTEPVRDGILRHSSGAGEPATLEGKIVRLVDRIAYINHDIDDALRAGVLAPRGPARATRSRCSATRAPQRIDTLVHDLVEHSERGRRHRPGRRGRRGDAAAARRSCSSASTSARRRAREHAAHRARAARPVRLVLRAPGASCPSRRAGRDARPTA